MAGVFNNNKIKGLLCFDKQFKNDLFICSDFLRIKSKK